MACAAVESASVAEIIIHDAALIPISYYLLAVVACSLFVLYNFLEFHIVADILGGMRGDAVKLTFHRDSDLYAHVVSKCRVLHGRYIVTPWLASPHLQTAFLNFFGRPPKFDYRRQLYTLRDGGMVALDWLFAYGVAESSVDEHNSGSNNVTTPIVVVIPGLTSDSSSSYLKHIVHTMAKRGWNVVVNNHRGLGGVSMTSDCFYNAGWTEDCRELVNYIHQKYPNAPLFAIGTSIGANILVKYLGEDGVTVPVAGAAAICSPWDLVVCDRFINRKLVQRFYNKALTIGLRGYAQSHEPTLTRLANWDGIQKSRSVRDFDKYATCLLGKFETVDTYYRCCSSASFVRNVSVPLLCISALDDPVCTREAIPWEECRANKNIVLVTTLHGGHLAFFEGLLAVNLWWTRAVDEFFSVLRSSSFMHRQQENCRQDSELDSTIDESPYVKEMEDGMIASVIINRSDHKASLDENDSKNQAHFSSDKEKLGMVTEGYERGASSGSISEPAVSLESRTEAKGCARVIDDSLPPLKWQLNQLIRRSGGSMWLVAFISFVTSWPLLGSLLFIVYKRKLGDLSWLRRR